MTTPETTRHPDDALVDLVTGAPVAPEVTAHVAGCSRCTDELVVLRQVLGHVRAPAPELVSPPPELWDRVAAELDAAPAPAAVPPSVPAPVADPASVAAPLPGPPADVRPLRRASAVRGISPWWLAAAAAAGLVVGGVGVGLVDRPEPAPAPVVLASTSLDTLDTSQARGAASAVREDGHLDLDVDTARLDPAGGYLEVWLINTDLKRMVSVGVLRPDAGSQRFAIDQALIDEGYLIVDISREGFDEKPEHSGDSLVRGTLAL
jgi:anti-sigma-K factor RskA